MPDKRVRYVALDTRVIAVAAEGNDNDWAAYIGAVQGLNHDKEWQDVLEQGSKLPVDIAELLFPDFKKLSWRY